MADVAPAATPVKAPRKAACSLQKAHPCVGKLVVAVTTSKEKRGASLVALKNCLCADGYGVQKNNSRVKLAIKSLVSKGTLVQTKGSGASGSFKLNKQHAEAKKKPAKKAAPAVKKPAEKKPVAAKKTKNPAADKKSTKKAVRKAKASTAPKEATRKAAKPTATKTKKATSRKRL